VQKGEIQLTRIEILLFSLKGESTLCVESKDGNIDTFAYELFTKFDHIIDEKNHSIILNDIQENNTKTKLSIAEIVSKYSQKMPQINKLNTFLNKLDENEKFCTIVLSRKLTQEEYYKLGCKLMSLNMPDFDIAKHLQQSNELFKNIWDNYNLIATNVEKKNRIGESDKKKRVCRFCGKSLSTGATFKNEAHAISEALGNKTVIFNEECDICNSYFDQTIERDFITYLNIFRTFFGILNKSNKIPSVVGKNFEYQNLGNRNTILKLFSDDTEVNDTKPPENIPLIFNDKITAQNIYKTLVKYSLSIIEKIEENRFNKTIEWIRNPIFKDRLPKIAVLSSYVFFKEHPSLMVYLRKSENNKLPYAIGEFHFTFMTFVFIIPTFDDEEPDFSIQENYDIFWHTFKHYDMSKEFQFQEFSDPIDRNVQFIMSFKQSDKLNFC